MAKAMSEKTQRIYDQIKYHVEHARKQSYEEWLGKCHDSYGMRKLYRETCSGIVYGYYDGRSLAALERRGLIHYYDDMERDAWCIILIED